MQVLFNLLDNAVKHTPRGGVTVELSIVPDRSPPTAKLSVADTGEGIAPEQRDHVFEKFAQAGRRSRQGLGLGLFIARKVVEAHGGRIWYEPNPGGGSVFALELPLLEP